MKGKELEEIRREISEGKVRLSTVFKHALVFGTISAINIYAGLISLIVWLIRRGYIKKKERETLLHELHEELEIVEEKIKDANYGNDKKKKYQYIRLRREIRRAIDRIKYGKSILRPNMNQPEAGGHL